MSRLKFAWANTVQITQVNYVCGYCSNNVGPNNGYYASNERFLTTREKAFKHKIYIYICPKCYRPTFFDSDRKQYPGLKLGNDITGISDAQLYSLYDEARQCSGVGAYTATVLISRKILMHIAVDKGANESESFTAYIDFLEHAGYIPPNGKDWADHIRKKGNEMNHQINIADESEAKKLLSFVEMLLRFSYEFPNMIKSI